MRIGQKDIDAHEMLVSGSDSAGRQLALALRKAVGTKKVAVDLQRYGFKRGDELFWAEVDPQWSKRLRPKPAYALIDAFSDEDWSSALSIGESHMMMTALHVWRFLQAVGNNGFLCPPMAKRLTGTIEPAQKQACSSPIRILNEATARQLAAAMLDLVKRGTATRIADALVSTGWTIGGKTGTGGISGAPMSKQNGWFAGLIFDRHQKPHTGGDAGCTGRLDCSTDRE
jgi:cell division protein FtsI/penicillin-binding protein 2